MIDAGLGSCALVSGDGDQPSDATRDSGARSKPCRPLRRMGYARFRNAVARELLVLAPSLPHGKVRRAMKRRAWRLVRCGQLVRVRECGDCGEARPGSGVLGGYDARCESRCCPVCARARSAGVREWLGRALDVVHKKASLHWTGAAWVELPNPPSWKFITLTVRRDVTDPAEHDHEALRKRLRALQRGWRRIWATWRHLPHAAAFYRVELAGTGHVHAHILVLGPSSVAQQWVARELGAATAELTGNTAEPFVKIQTVKHAEVISELAKYVTKIPGIYNEGWLAGHNLEVSDPRLVAAWELATYGQRTYERYGALRRIPLDESVRHGEEILLSAAERAELDPTHCPACGCEGRYRWGVWRGSVESWIGWCWSKGAREALARPLEVGAPLERNESEARQVKETVVLARTIRRAARRAEWALWVDRPDASTHAELGAAWRKRSSRPKTELLAERRLYWPSLRRYKRQAVRPMYEPKESV